MFVWLRQLYRGARTLLSIDPGGSNGVGKTTLPSHHQNIEPHLVSHFEEEARGMMPKTNTTPETSHEEEDRSAEYTQPKISDYGDLVKVTATALCGPGLSCPW